MKITSHRLSTLTLKDTMIALAIIGLLAVFAVPHFVKMYAPKPVTANTTKVLLIKEHREQRKIACIANQNVIERKLDAYASEHGLTNSTTLSAAVINDLIRGACPEGGQ